MLARWEVLRYLSSRQASIGDASCSSGDRGFQAPPHASRAVSRGPNGQDAGSRIAGVIAIGRRIAIILRRVFPHRRDKLHILFWPSRGHHLVELP